METVPLISIITPVYNVERYLSRCIESILGQTFQRWELLLVDDGSTDRSGVICDTYALQDARIRIIHKENTGQADSRNMALHEARGTLIGFVDSDDWIEPDMYETLWKTLETNGADIAICGYSLDYKDSSEPSCNEGDTLVYTGDEALELILEDKTIKSFLWDKLFRRELLTEPMPKSYYYEDYATLFKWFLNANKVAFCRQPKYHYRQRKGSTDHDSDPQKKYHFFLAEKERCDFLKEHGILQQYSRVFSEKVVSIGIQEAKGIARRAGNNNQGLFYVRQIRDELKNYLPVSRKTLGWKKYIRLWKLQHALPWFVFSLRFSRLFIFGNNKKQKRYYE